MGAPAAPPSYTLSVDSKRRPTFPPQLLEAARIRPEDQLVARAEGEGRIVLETRAAVKQRMQGRFQTAAKTSRGRDLVGELFHERTTDDSLPR
jgi:bifunctional DNA-binding transcriptional regulator/antitoxin component of YhaV-PrlF toxin-antitoxin module